MDVVLWILAYMAIGVIIMAFIWSNGGNDLTVGDALFGLVFAAAWPLVVTVIGCKWAHDNKVMSLVLWKRK